jgi:hypothetical protein
VVGGRLFRSAPKAAKQIQPGPKPEPFTRFGLEGPFAEVHNDILPQQAIMVEFDLICRRLRSKCRLVLSTRSRRLSGHLAEDLPRSCEIFGVGVLLRRKAPDTG